MSEPLDLEPIKARVNAAMLDGSWDEPETRDRERLLAEVERLRTELARRDEQIAEGQTSIRNETIAKIAEIQRGEVQNGPRGGLKLWSMIYDQVIAPRDEQIADVRSFASVALEAATNDGRRDWLVVLRLLDGGAS